MTHRAIMPDRTPPSGTDEPTTIALVVNTRNEAENMAGLVETAKGVDEVIVGDMASDDATPEIARGLGAKVIDLPNFGYANPGRMTAIEAATSEWVLVLDADERLSPGSVEQLRSLLASTPLDVAAYRLPRVNFLGSRAIRGSGWGFPAELHARLFRRDAVDWPPTIHSQPSFTGRVLDLPEGGPVRIDHANFRDLTHLLDKLNAYSSIEAKQIVSTGSEPNLPTALRFALEEVVNRYDPEGDGSLSLALAMAMFGYRFNSHAKAIEELGWEDGEPIARPSLVAAINAMWSVLRRRELTRIMDEVAGMDEGDALTKLRRATSIWADMPPTLASGGVEAVGDELIGPWEELLADATGRNVGLVQALVEARAALHEQRRRSLELESRLSRLFEEHAETLRLFDELVETAETSARRQQETEQQLARDQQLLAEAQAELGRRPRRFAASPSSRVAAVVRELRRFHRRDDGPPPAGKE